MRSRMRKLLAAAVLMMSMAGALAAGALIIATLAVAEEARPISHVQLQKILKFVDTIGGKEEFPPPTAQNLGVSSDPN
jgi:hypothetical protein